MLCVRSLEDIYNINTAFPVTLSQSIAHRSLVLFFATYSPTIVLSTSSSLCHHSSFFLSFFNNSHRSSWWVNIWFSSCMKSTEQYFLWKISLQCEGWLLPSVLKSYPSYLIDIWMFTLCTTSAFHDMYIVNSGNF